MESKICFLRVPAHVGVVGNWSESSTKRGTECILFIEMNIPLCKEEVTAIFGTDIKGKWQV